MGALKTEVNRFREWANTISPEHHSGEWECGYERWADLYDAVLISMADGPPEAWTDEALQDILYAVARDNEDEYLASEIRLRHPATLIALARAVSTGGEADAKWQLAEQLGHLGGSGGEVEQILLILVRDQEEHVRRRALRALTRIGSPEAERLALDAWRRPDEHQKYARIMALTCLHRISSQHLGALLDEADRDERPYLRNCAGRIRRGESDL